MKNVVHCQQNIQEEVWKRPISVQEEFLALAPVFASDVVDVLNQSHCPSQPPWAGLTTHLSAWVSFPSPGRQHSLFFPAWKKAEWLQGCRGKLGNLKSRVKTASFNPVAWVVTHTFFLPLESCVSDHTVQPLLHASLVSELPLQLLLSGFQLLMQRTSFLLVDFSRFLQNVNLQQSRGHEQKTTTDKHT